MSNFQNIARGVQVMSDALFKSVGGRKTVLVGGDPKDPAHEVWNFGVTPKPTALAEVIHSKPSFHARFPKLKGKWDGKTTVNHVAAALKVLGSEEKVEELIQYQPRGTCGGRSGSAACDFVQLLMMAAGKRFKFHRVSHAGVYYFARKLYNMVNGSWTDENGDGVASGAVPEALTKIGLVSRDESGDTNYYGDGSDDLACQLGAGMKRDLATKLEEAAKDNIITEWAPVTSAAEAADGIASGGILIGSDNRGFTMSRDGNGFCRPQGTWAHYHTRVSVLGAQDYGQNGFGYWQSWGKTTPAGTKLAGHPGNCFGVDWNTQDRSIKSGDYAVVFGFAPFELEEDKIDVSWSF